MRILLTGGSACGKSTFAEALAAHLPEPRYYVATMRPYDGECLRRIARHRAQRAGRGFETLELPADLASLALPARGTALLECVCNLCANEMFPEPDYALRDPFGAVMDGIAALEAQCRDLIVVTNEVGAGGGDYSAATLRYMEALGRINRALAARFDCVCELVCGIPLVHKGALP